MNMKIGWALLAATGILGAAAATTSPSPEQLKALLKKYPAADSNRDGVLTLDEAKEYRQKMLQKRQRTAGAAAPAPGPTHRDLRYGPHARNVLDLWLAVSNRPSPLIVFIHGGGFVGGDKSKASPRSIASCLEAGVSYAAINYRFREQAPIQDILRDAARAIQFLRLHAKVYGLDPRRVACYGGSAGAGTSLWLATRDDLADPKNDDPVLRQSTRLSAAACLNGQATYDLTKWETVVGPFRPEWRSDPDEDMKFYHFKNRDELSTDAGRKVLAECDMLRWISKDDPPLYLHCRTADGEPGNRGQYVHHPKHPRAVKQRCDETGVPCEIALSGGGEEEAVRFLVKRLRAPK